MKVKVIYPPDTKNTKKASDSIREYEYDSHATEPLAICEEVFRQFNRVDGTEHIARAKLEERSFSVGDMVEIDGITYLCSMVGFRTIEKDEKEKLFAMTFAERQYHIDERLDND